MGKQTAVVLPYWLDRPPLEALDIARVAERRGFRELWVGEMLAFDAFALAGAVAAQTTAIELWVGPLAAAVRDPVSLARGAASVSALGGRPAHLALGASTPVVVEGWHGRQWRANVERIRETVRVVRALFDGGREREYRLQLGPQASRIAIAAAGPKMLALAAELADRVVLNLVTPEQVARVRGAVGGTPIVAWIPAALDPGEASWAQAARQLVAYVGARGYGEQFAEAGFEEVVELARSGAHPREVMAAIPRDLVASVAAMGDHDTVKRRLTEYRVAGVDVAGIVPVTADDSAGERILEALSEEGEPG